MSLQLAAFRKLYFHEECVNCCIWSSSVLSLNPAGCSSADEEDPVHAISASIQRVTTCAFVGVVPHFSRGADQCPPAASLGFQALPAPGRRAGPPPRNPSTGFAWQNELRKAWTAAGCAIVRSLHFTAFPAGSINLALRFKTSLAAEHRRAPVDFLTSAQFFTNDSI